MVLFQGDFNLSLLSKFHLTYFPMLICRMDMPTLKKIFMPSVTHGTNQYAREISRMNTNITNIFKYVNNIDKVKVSCSCFKKIIFDGNKKKTSLVQYYTKYNRNDSISLLTAISPIKCQVCS